MKQRIFSGWTFTRALYAITGTFIIVQSVIQHEWMGIFAGGYFAAMGIFAFGCAAENCFGGNCNVDTFTEAKTKVQNAEFEEIKTK